MHIPTGLLPYHISDSVHCCLDRCKKLIIGLECRELRIILLDLLGRAEEEACFTRLDHAEVIEAVAACDRIEADRLERLDGCQLGFFAAHLVAGNCAVLCRK